MQMFSLNWREKFIHEKRGMNADGENKFNVNYFAWIMKKSC